VILANGVLVLIMAKVVLVSHWALPTATDQATFVGQSQLGVKPEHLPEHLHPFNHE